MLLLHLVIRMVMKGAVIANERPSMLKGTISPARPPRAAPVTQYMWSRSVTQNMDQFLSTPSGGSFEARIENVSSHMPKMR